MLTVNIMKGKFEGSTILFKRQIGHALVCLYLYYERRIWDVF